MELYVVEYVLYQEDAILHFYTMGTHAHLTIPYIPFNLFKENFNFGTQMTVLVANRFHSTENAWHWSVY